ncbi:MAG: RNA methyltransferase [Pseudomonadota bacterium]
MKHISSRENPFFKNLIKLAQSSRERKKQGLTLIDGTHLIEVYRERVGLPQILVVSESGMQNREITTLLKKFAVLQPVVLDDGLFKDISNLVTPAGVMAVIPTPQPEKIPEKLDLCLACEGVQDPGNLGSILRSAAAAGVQHIFLSKDCVSAWAPRVTRAGQGAHFLLSIHEGADLFSMARSFSGKVVATTLDTTVSLFDMDLTGALMLLIGNEGAGISAGLMAFANHKVKIPMPGGMESLNAAAAAAVCLFERVRQTNK